MTDPLAEVTPAEVRTLLERLDAAADALYACLGLLDPEHMDETLNAARDAASWARGSCDSYSSSSDEYRLNLSFEPAE